MEVAHSFSSGFCLCGYLQFTPMKRYEFFCCTIFYNLSNINPKDRVAHFVLYFKQLQKLCKITSEVQI
ncbi:hypothetical protein SANR_0233 [Streptococcus anginosus C238]|nr:hypothetical protein SANR_0233 [Streptococcus anginosus C238]